MMKRNLKRYERLASFIEGNGGSVKVWYSNYEGLWSADLRDYTDRLICAADASTPRDLLERLSEQFEEENSETDNSDND